MSRFMGRSTSQSRGMGDISRLLIGFLVVMTIGYIGLVYAPQIGMAYFWPFAGIWAAVGWGGRRISMKPVILLMIVGLLTDLSVEGPVGCWVAVHLAAYLVATLFRKRAQTDRSGLVRLLGDAVALVVAFLIARWIMGAYKGGLESGILLGQFLTTAILYVPFRPLFLFKKERWVEA